MEKSYFDGGLLQLIGWRLVGILITFFTLGICYPWACCMIYEWETKHTVINGKRLYFNGTALQLFGNWIKWWFLTLITLGIYGFWVGIKTKKWIVKHTEFIDQTSVPVFQNSNNSILQHSENKSTVSISPSSNTAFYYTSKDMVRAEAMSSYVTRFEFNFGLTEKDCSKLFSFVERAVSPDVEVVSAFIAKKNGTPCACAMAISKLIIADDWETRTIQTLDISGFTYENGTLTVKSKADDIILSVSAQRGQAICDVCNQSLIACKKEIESNSKVNV